MKWVLDQTTSDNAAKHLPALATEYFHAGRKAVKSGKSPAELHSFRGRTKQFRYSLELFQPVYGAPLDLKLEALRDLQTLLGKVSDVYTTHELLRDDPKLARQLQRDGKKKVAKFRDYWKKTFDKAGELKAWKQFLAQTSGPVAVTSIRKSRKRSAS